ncbi:hypothetical protein DNTS_029800 [Danionella cerebrum]|uniref:Uncharacterized protein n=1 Tax=Danionella cerebrum TaxID=2873325 RepID=A0A553MLA2_9TELE|nr:hypothetical protein DNTS_029800 [Danionella translucida]TRY53954.1 hypothetical protein DNTS_029800 [Danionella translucida]
MIESRAVSSSYFFFLDAVCRVWRHEVQEHALFVISR